MVKKLSLALLKRAHEDVHTLNENTEETKTYSQICNFGCQLWTVEIDAVLIQSL